MALKQKWRKKKKPPLVPDILFRMPIKDNVTCKTRKLLLALHLPPLLRPSSHSATPAVDRSSEECQDATDGASRLNQH